MEMTLLYSKYSHVHRTKFLKQKHKVGFILLQTAAVLPEAEDVDAKLKSRFKN